METIVASKPNSGFLAVFAESVSNIKKYNSRFSSAADQKGDLLNKLDINAFPSFFLVKDGKIIDYWVGWSSDVENSIKAKL